LPEIRKTYSYLSLLVYLASLSPFSVKRT